MKKRNEILEAAKKYRDKFKFSIIPVNPQNKKPAISEWEPYKTRRATDEELDSWFSNGQPRMIGVVTGKISELFALDIDNPAEGIPGVAPHLTALGKQLVPTEQTPKRGLHQFYRCIGTYPPNNQAPYQKIKGVDTRGEGGYIILSPSVNAEGKDYHFLKGLSLDEVEIPILPKSLYDLYINGNGSMPSPTIKPGESFFEYGSRDNSLFTVANGLIKSGADTALVRETLERLIKSWGEAADPRWVEAKIKSALKRQTKREAQAQETLKDLSEDISTHLTDMADARRLARLHGENIRFNHEKGKWIHWDGKRWAEDNGGKIKQLARDLPTLLYKEAAEEQDNDRRAKLADHAIKCESNQRLDQVIKLLQSEPGIPILLSDFDRNNYQYNFLNGTLNLITAELLPHDPSDYITKLCPVEYDPNAKCPEWLKHLNKIQNGNQNIIGFMQRFYGYCLTGSVDERCLAINWGTGRNGKSLTQETIASVMGENYCIRTTTESLLVKREDNVRNDVATLRGSRLAYCSEAEADKRLAESLIKDITGGDVIRARFLYCESFQFKPTFKISLSTNHLPSIRNTDLGIWSRIRLIPFTYTIPESEIVPMEKMLASFQAEAAGIMNWLVQGCLEWRKNGLQTPEEVRKATNEYKSDQDVLADFITDCCIVDQNEECTNQELYSRFFSWSESEGIPIKKIASKSSLSRRMKERGFIQDRDNVSRIWKGIRLKPLIPNS